VGCEASLDRISGRAVADLGDISAQEALGGVREGVEVNARGRSDMAHIHLEDGDAPRLVGQRNVNELIRKVVPFIRKLWDPLKYYFHLCL
jgi:hypothetical protein